MLIALPTATAAYPVSLNNNINSDITVSQTVNETKDVLAVKYDTQKENDIKLTQAYQKKEQAVREEINNLGTFKVTAYCPCAKCNGKWEGQTATGVTPKQGITVAVDKSIIPLGTKIYIEGVGEFIAQDTGVKGKAIDVYMSSHEDALQWGVKSLKVSIIK